MPRHKNLTQYVIRAIRRLTFKRIKHEDLAILQIIRNNMRNEVDAEEKQQDREGDELNSVSSISYRTIDCLGVEEDRTAGSNATRAAGPLEIFAAGVIANVA